MFKLASTTYNTRHYNEIKRYFDEGANILHIVNENNEYTFDSKIETKYINIEDDIQNVLNQDKKYDLIIVTDIFELSSDIYYFLDNINCSINHNGKLLITSINTKWIFRYGIRYEFIINCITKSRCRNSGYSFINKSNYDFIFIMDIYKKDSKYSSLDRYYSCNLWNRINFCLLILYLILLIVLYQYLQVRPSSNP